MEVSNVISNLPRSATFSDPTGGDSRFLAGMRWLGNRDSWVTSDNPSAP